MAPASGSASAEFEPCCQGVSTAPDARVHQPGGAGRPHAALGVRRQAQHGRTSEAREPVLVGLEAGEAAAVQADPDAAQAVARDRAHEADRQAVRIVRLRVVDAEAVAVPAGDAVLRARPQVALGVLGDAGGDGVRQAVVLAQVFEHGVGHADPADAGGRGRGGDGRRRRRCRFRGARGQAQERQREAAGERATAAGARACPFDLIASPPTHSFALLACCPVACHPASRCGKNGSAARETGRIHPLSAAGTATEAVCRASAGNPGRPGGSARGEVKLPA